MYNQYSNIKNYIYELIELCKNNVLDKNLYENILKKMIPYLPEIKAGEHSNYLNNIIFKENILLDNYDDISTKLYYWRDYLFWELWKKLRYESIGHLSDFYISNKHFVLKINLNLDVVKKNNESKEEHSIRKEEFFKNTKYQYGTNKISNRKLFVDCDNNKNLLIDYLRTFIVFKNYEFKVRNNFLQEIIIYANDFIINEYTENKTNFNIAFLENIIKEANTTLLAIDTYSITPNEIGKIANSLISSFFCYVCRGIGFNNEYLKKYDKIVLCNREQNIVYNEKKKQLGRTYEIQTILDTIHDFKNKIELYLANEYCISIDDFYYNGHFNINASFNIGSCRLTSEFNNSPWPENKGFLLDEYCIEKDTYLESYKISIEATNSIKCMLNQKFNATDIKISIKDYEKNFIINSIAFSFDTIIENLK